MSNETKRTVGVLKMTQEGVDSEWHILTIPGGRIIANVHIETGNQADIAAAASLVESYNNYDRVLAERDELVAIVKKARTWLTTYDLWSDVIKRNIIIREIEAALAKLETK